MSENLTPGTIPVCFLVSTIVYVLDMGYCDFHGATLQVGLTGQRRVYAHIMYIYMYGLRYTRRCQLDVRAGRASRLPFKCTGWVPLYVHIYVQEDVRPGIVRAHCHS